MTVWAVLTFVFAALTGILAVMWIYAAPKRQDIFMNVAIVCLVLTAIFWPVAFVHSAWWWPAFLLTVMIIGVPYLVTVIILQPQHNRHVSQR